MFPCLSLKWILLIEFTGLLATDTGSLVQGRLGQNITLPCHYSTSEHGTVSICWGKGSCPLSKCSGTIVWTNVLQEIYEQSSKYHLMGDVPQGDVSLTIVNLTDEDAGTYCCSVDTPGPFNDLKINVRLALQKGNSGLTSSEEPEPSWISSTEPPPEHVSLCFSTLAKEQRKEATSRTDLYVTAARYTFILLGILCGVLLILKFLTSGAGSLVQGRLGQNITLPCHYSTSEHGISSICWGKGPCPLSKCSGTIVWTDVPQEIHGQSSKYHLKGDVPQGDVSLTIVNVTDEDAGTYCCRVEIPGPFNDLKINVILVLRKGNLGMTSSAVPVHPTTTCFSGSWSVVEAQSPSSTEFPPHNISAYITTMVKQQRKKEKSWTVIYASVGISAVFLITMTLLFKWYLQKKQKMSNATSQIAFSGSETGEIQHVSEAGVRAVENIYELN